MSAWFLDSELSTCYYSDQSLLQFLLYTPIDIFSNQVEISLIYVLHLSLFKPSPHIDFMLHNKNTINFAKVCVLIHFIITYKEWLIIVISLYAIITIFIHNIWTMVIKFPLWKQ